MKTASQSNVMGRPKPKKAKKIAKAQSALSIAKRYMELQRLRERVSAVESRLYAR